jgi:uncharacterized membrane protein
MGRNALRAACVVCLALGVFFRLFHADWKLYSYDETVTSLRATGHTYGEFERFVHDGRSHSIGDLTMFQAPSATTDGRLVWQSLALEDPQHPPLYFLATSLLERATGDSVFLRRLPAILFGLLSLPAAWWLAYELFEDSLVAWCFTALVAVSPFHVEYAQQAREYSLWTLITLISSALLLRSLRRGAAWTFIAYAVSVGLGLWSFPLFVEVAVAQGLYLGGPFSATLGSRRWIAGAALAVGLVTFVPWARVMAAGTRTAVSDTGWTAGRLSAPLYLGKWLFNAGTVFFDLDYVTLLLAPVAFLLVAVALWSCWRFVRTAPMRQWSFVALVGGISALTLLVPDLVLHQSRAGQSRYLTPLWLAVELAVAYALTFRPEVAERRVFRGVALYGFLIAGVVSCAVGSVARTWWIASNQKTLPAIASALALQPSATLTYVDDDDMLLEILPLSRPSLRFMIHSEIDAGALGASPDSFFIAKPFAVDQSPAARHSRKVALPAFFPPTQDRAIELIHRRAAAERNMGAAYQDDALFAVTQGAG